MNEQVQTVIIGGGQAGLATSYWLKQHRHEHIILEQAAQAANAWRNDRWGSFTLVTPNWATRMPGVESLGADPNGFMPRDEAASSTSPLHVDHYARVCFGACSRQAVCRQDDSRVPGSGEEIL